MPNIAIDTAMKATWVPSVTLKIRVSRISNISVAMAMKKIPRYSVQQARVGMCAA